METFKNCEIVGSTKDNPVWTKNEFVGPPPIGYNSWSEWIEKSTESGLFTGVCIKRR